MILFNLRNHLQSLFTAKSKEKPNVSVEISPTRINSFSIFFIFSSNPKRVQMSARCISFFFIRFYSLGKKEKERKQTTTTTITITAEKLLGLGSSWPVGLIECFCFVLLNIFGRYPQQC